MLTFRCTRKLLKRPHVDGLDEGAVTTRLGDWYGNLLFTRYLRLVICVSERSLLPVFVEAKDFSTSATRFRAAVRLVLDHIVGQRVLENVWRQSSLAGERIRAGDAQLWGVKSTHPAWVRTSSGRSNARWPTSLPIRRICSRVARLGGGSCIGFHSALYTRSSPRIFR
jgi:hypothetical protein